MALDPVANFVRGSTDAATDSTQTTISVVDASVFPDPANGEYNLVLWYDNSHPRPDQDPDVEIVRVTARDTTNDDLTVTRGREGTTGVSHPSGSAVHLSPTAKMFADIPDNFVSNSGDTMTGNLDLQGTNGVTFGGEYRQRYNNFSDSVKIFDLSSGADVGEFDETGVRSLPARGGSSLSNVLTTADEGSGNGLDADTVDGQEANELGKSTEQVENESAVWSEGVLPRFGGN